ncbi:hypothetical protein ABTB76_19610, partial [Acinetobacter baumannii]
PKPAMMPLALEANTVKAEPIARTGVCGKRRLSYVATLEAEARRRLAIAGSFYRSERKTRNVRTE